VIACAFSLVLLGSIVLPVSSSAASKNCITVYEHTNYKGKSLKFCEDNYKKGIPNLKKYNFNDKISSYKVTGKRVYLYEHANFKGKKIWPEESNESNGKRPKTHFNDIISSIKW
jgi:hypothetical protein